MRTVVGQVARGKNFWARPNELQDIWNAIESGCHVLLTAPRRVGKTSIMCKVLDEPKANYIPVYVNTESADSQQEFWQKLFHALEAQNLPGNLKTSAKLFGQKLLNSKIKKVTVSSIEFEDDKEGCESKALRFVDAFRLLLNNLQSDQKVVFLIDEFAQTIENITKYENDQNAISLLKNHRELRQDKQFCEKVTFVYAGSIGLESVVAKIDASRHINDLNSVKVKPLEQEDASDFARQLFASQKKEISEETVAYLLNKIEWLIPFYLQLMVQEVSKILRHKKQVTPSAIDKAFDEALSHKQYFESWLSKIKTSFKNEEFLLAKTILNQISECHTIEHNQIINLGAKQQLDEDASRFVLRSLVYDGYINNHEQAKTYRFNSPILRTWWNRNVAN